jgi:hypothetical protein
VRLMRGVNDGWGKRAHVKSKESVQTENMPDWEKKEW